MIGRSVLFYGEEYPTIIAFLLLLFVALVANLLLLVLCMQDAFMLQPVYIQHVAMIEVTGLYFGTLVADRVGMKTTIAIPVWQDQVSTTFDFSEKIVIVELESGRELARREVEPDEGTASRVAVLLTEPTPFGLNDLKLAASMTLEMGIPTGIVVNRSDGEDRIIAEWAEIAERKNSRVVARIPFDRAVNSALMEGKTVVKYGKSAAADAIINAWQEVQAAVKEIS